MKLGIFFWLMAAEVRVERKNGIVAARLIVVRIHAALSVAHIGIMVNLVHLQKGVNACYVKSADDAGYVGKDEEQTLASGDTIYFCGQSYPFILTISNLSSSNASSESSVTGKR